MFKVNTKTTSMANDLNYKSAEYAFLWFYERLMLCLHWAGKENAKALWNQSSVIIVLLVEEMQKMMFL